MKFVAYLCSNPVFKESLRDFEEVQALDARLLYGVEHVIFAFQKAKKAMKRGDNISSNILVETLVRASGQRQIKKALEMYGLKGSREIVVFGPEISEEFLNVHGATETDLEIDEMRMNDLKKVFSITDLELDAVSDSPDDALKYIINERIALTSVL